MRLLRILFFLVLLVSGLSCAKNKQAPATGQSTDPKTMENTIKMFSSIPSSTSGVTFKNDIEENAQRHYSNFNPIYDGGGVATGDINNDGLPDLYFTGNEVDNRLYINKGDFKFED